MLNLNLFNIKHWKSFFGAFRSIKLKSSKKRWKQLLDSDDLLACTSSPLSLGLLPIVLPVVLIKYLCPDWTSDALIEMLTYFRKPEKLKTVIEKNYNNVECFGESIAQKNLLEAAKKLDEYEAKQLNSSGNCQGLCLVLTSRLNDIELTDDKNANENKIRGCFEQFQGDIKSPSSDFIGKVSEFHRQSDDSHFSRIKRVNKLSFTRFFHEPENKKAREAQKAIPQGFDLIRRHAPEIDMDKYQSGAILSFTVPYYVGGHVMRAGKFALDQETTLTLYWFYDPNLDYMVLSKNKDGFESFLKDYIVCDYEKRGSSPHSLTIEDETTGQSVKATSEQMRVFVYTPFSKVKTLFEHIQTIHKNSKEQDNSVYEQCHKILNKPYVNLDSEVCLLRQLILQSTSLPKEQQAEFVQGLDDTYLNDRQDYLHDVPEELKPNKAQLTEEPTVISIL